MSPPSEDRDDTMHVAPSSSQLGEEVPHDEGMRQRCVAEPEVSREKPSIVKPKSSKPRVRIKTYQPRSAEMTARRKKHDRTKSSCFQRCCCLIAVTCVLSVTALQVRYIMLRHLFDQRPTTYFKVSWDMPIPHENVSIMDSTVLRLADGSGPAESVLTADEISYIDFAGSGWAFPVSLTFDFMRPEPICGVLVKPQRALGSPKSFLIEASGDGLKWTPLEKKNFKEPWSERTNWKLPGYTARFWRFSIDDSFNNTAPAISYVQFYESVRSAERRLNATMAAAVAREIAREEEL